MPITDPAEKPPALPDDYHIHTPLCRHASGTAAEYCAAARKTGLKEICFTDHAPAPGGYDSACRMRLEEFGEYSAGVRAAATADAPLVLFGIEADYYGGCRNFLERWLAETPFDLVLGSVHYIGDWAFDAAGNTERWNNVDVPAVWREYFKLIAELADSRLYDVLAHPDLPKKFGHRIGDKLLRELAAPALDRVAAAGMALEINTAGLRKPVREIYPGPLILEMARARAIPIVFGSDAHKPGQVGAGFERAVELAAAAGYRERVVYRRREYRATPLLETSGNANLNITGEGTCES